MLLLECNIALQCCISFCCITKWITCMYKYIHIYIYTPYIYIYIYIYIHHIYHATPIGHRWALSWDPCAIHWTNSLANTTYPVLILWAFWGSCSYVWTNAYSMHLKIVNWWIIQEKQFDKAPSLLELINPEQAYWQ